jgi:hypothetical protein
MAPLGSTKLIGTHQNQFILLDLSFKWESSFMTFFIVLNNKKLDFLMGLLLLLILNDNFFFKLLKEGSLDYLVVIIEELTTCVAIEMQLL